MEDIVVVTAAYLVGSIPFAYFVARRRGVDLRTNGSGNVGATNVLRTAGVRAAILAMLLDGLKGSAAVLVAERLSGGAATPMAAGLASVVGHIYPLWLRFRGGKGVATAAGVFGVLAPSALLAASAVFVVAVWVTRYISLGSIAAAVTLAIVTLFSEAPAVVNTGTIAMMAMILHRHRANIVRLMAGTERRIGQRLFADGSREPATPTPSGG
jgi:glycerol-3-phosphate acyltransferase PlsY